MTPKMSRAPLCESRRSDGAPCAAPRRPGSLFCYSHDPVTAEERKAAHAKGVAVARDARTRRQEKRAREAKR